MTFVRYSAHLPTAGRAWIEESIGEKPGTGIGPGPLTTPLREPGWPIDRGAAGLSLKESSLLGHRLQGRGPKKFGANHRKVLDRLGFRGASVKKGLIFMTSEDTSSTGGEPVIPPPPAGSRPSAAGLGARARTWS